MLERTKARRQALNILYQREITADTVEGILDERSFNLDEDTPLEFCLTLVSGVGSHQDEIDVVLSDISEHWTVARMPLVDRSILRMAVYEILFLDDVPDSVSINEAVEMAKIYGGDDSSKFVNGVLGKLAEERSSDDESSSDGRIYQ